MSQKRCRVYIFAREKLKLGERCNVLEGDQWRPAELVEVERRKVKIHYLGEHTLCAATDPYNVIDRGVCAM
jgi:hypothetical protein